MHRVRSRIRKMKLTNEHRKEIREAVNFHNYTKNAIYIIETANFSIYVNYVNHGSWVRKKIDLIQYIGGSAPVEVTSDIIFFEFNNIKEKV